MTTDHRAEAEKALAEFAGGPAGSVHAEHYRNLFWMHSTAATLADRCPDPAAHQAANAGDESTPLGRLLDKVGVENPEDAATATVIANLKTDNEDARDLLAKRAATIIELRRALGEANELLAEARVALDHEEFAPAGYIPAQAHLLVQEEVTRLRTELAEARAARPAPTASESGTEYGIQSGWLVEYVDEHTCGTGPNGHYGRHEPGCGTVPVAPLADLLARAARPAPMPPEVVAVVEAAQDWATNARRAREYLSHTGTALLAKVEALPEDWRDGAAPAAVPAASPSAAELNQERESPDFLAGGGSRPERYVDHEVLGRVVPVGESWVTDAGVAEEAQVALMLARLPGRRLTRIVGHADGWYACNEGPDGGGSWIIRRPAPAAVPAELDPRTVIELPAQPDQHKVWAIDRRLLVLVEWVRCRNALGHPVGWRGKGEPHEGAVIDWHGLLAFAPLYLDREAAESAVRAYLGDTDTGSED